MKTQKKFVDFVKNCVNGNVSLLTQTEELFTPENIKTTIGFLKEIKTLFDKKNADAKKFDELTYDEVLARHLNVMDTTATSLSMDNDIPIIVFSLQDSENIKRVILGERIGTVVRKEA